MKVRTVLTDRKFASNRCNGWKMLYWMPNSNNRMQRYFLMALVENSARNVEVV